VFTASEVAVEIPSVVFVPPTTVSLLAGVGGVTVPTGAPAVVQPTSGAVVSSGLGWAWSGPHRKKSTVPVGSIGGVVPEPVIVAMSKTGVPGVTVPAATGAGGWHY
jgi:hypothetical protein